MVVPAFIMHSVTKSIIQMKKTSFHIVAYWRYMAALDNGTKALSDQMRIKHFSNTHPNTVMLCYPMEQSIKRCSCEWNLTPLACHSTNDCFPIFLPNTMITLLRGGRQLLIRDLQPEWPSRHGQPCRQGFNIGIVLKSFHHPNWNNTGNDIFT